MFHTGKFVSCSSLVGRSYHFVGIYSDLDHHLLSGTVNILFSNAILKSETLLILPSNELI